MKTVIYSLGTLALAAALTACGTPINNAQLGSATGAVLGGVAGHQFGKGDGKTAATAAGAALGAVVGGQAGAQQDRYYQQPRPAIAAPYPNRGY